MNKEKNHGGGSDAACKILAAQAITVAVALNRDWELCKGEMNASEFQMMFKTFDGRGGVMDKINRTKTNEKEMAKAKVKEGRSTQESGKEYGMGSVSALLKMDKDSDSVFDMVLDRFYKLSKECGEKADVKALRKKAIKITQLEIQKKFVQSTFHCVLYVRAYMKLIGMKKSERIVGKVQADLASFEVLIKKKTLHKGINECLDIIKELVPMARKLIRVAHPIAEHLRSYHFFSERLLSIEVCNDTQRIEKVYFRVPRLCDNKTDADISMWRKELTLQASGTDVVDMKAFVENSYGLFYHLKHKEKLKNKFLWGSFGLVHLGRLANYAEAMGKLQVRRAHTLLAQT